MFLRNRSLGDLYLEPPASNYPKLAPQAAPLMLPQQASLWVDLTMHVGLRGLCRFPSKQQCHCRANLGVFPPQGVGLLLCSFTPPSRITPLELGQGTDTWPQSSPEFIQGLGEQLSPQTHLREPGSGSKPL
ncbi:hypothetical protein KIL84_010083 [Mauremys mutica]|uniref:Uncharacterized protein n=1 Tax=Mauremys mutica TaxID=74926 RepID=A0A9D3XKL5_9SAUR|nr:hypothetical protein KIL84_010083 [Mauremys mutica]